MERTQKELEEQFNHFDDMMNGSLDGIQVVYNFYIGYFNDDPETVDEKMKDFATKTKKLIHDKQYKPGTKFVNPDYQKGFIGVLDLIITGGSGRELRRKSSGLKQA